MLIFFCDQLFVGLIIDIGGCVLGGIDSVLNNLFSELGEFGVIDERFRIVFDCNENEILEIIVRYVLEVDVDMIKVIIEFFMFEYIY